MANVFKNSISGSIGSDTVIVYEVPPSTVGTVIGLNIANVITDNISVDVSVTDVSETQSKFLLKRGLIVEGSSIVVVGGEQKLVLEEGDYISVVSSLPASADVVISVLEIS
jgi:uncharacterized Zn-binding protein involved in type VI secretion